MDLLRAASIVVVVLGHWLMAAPTVEGGVGFTLSDILRVVPSTQWLTWVFQVMPIFFAVGGYANAASWESARMRGLGYGPWVSRRLQRLVRPVIPFLVVWCALGLGARWLGVGEAIVQSGSRAAFVPLWFLAVYVGVVVVAPAMHALWRQFGLASFGALVLAVALVDAAGRLSGVDGVLWLNVIFVWLALHQLGYAWQAAALADAGRSLSLAIAGLTSLVVLEVMASYPVSMVTVPGGIPANGAPPTLALLSLGVLHVGLALALERRVSPALDRPRIWTSVVAINGVVMTLYLWHATVMVLLVGLAELVGGLGLRSVPGSPAWWLFRIPWVAALLICLTGFVALLGRQEARPVSRTLPTWRSLAGALGMCVGLVVLATNGIGGSGASGVRVTPLLLCFGGAILVTERPDARDPNRG